MRSKIDDDLPIAVATLLSKVRPKEVLQPTPDRHIAWPASHQECTTFIKIKVLKQQHSILASRVGHRLSLEEK